MCLYSLNVLQNLMNQINDKFTTNLDKKIPLLKLWLKLTALTYIYFFKSVCAISAKRNKKKHKRIQKLTLACTFSLCLFLVPTSPLFVWLFYLLPYDAGKTKNKTSSGWFPYDSSYLSQNMKHLFIKMFIATIFYFLLSLWNSLMLIPKNYTVC